MDRWFSGVTIKTRSVDCPVLIHIKEENVGAKSALVLDLIIR